MAMHRVPTLVLGIGGIGCRIAANISDLLSDEARERVGIIGIDTNVNDLTAVAARGVRTIQTSDTRTVGEYLLNHPEHLSWFPLNSFTASKSLLNGAGQIRAVSRLGALATEEKGGFIPIKEEIRRIRANRGDSSNGNLTVMVVGSITGGTGAGLFLQMPYYIRNLVRGDAGLKNIIIRGMFVGPDLTVDVQPSQINRDAVRVNGYACLKELNALYYRQLDTERANNMKIDFYSPVSAAEKSSIIDDVRSNWLDRETNDGYTLEAVRKDAKIIAQGNPDIPYDYLYLLESTSTDGSDGNAPLPNIESLAARMVHTLMFTPVSNNALSVEDNMILQDAAHSGMNRYSSAGMTRLVYPQELARDYVTLSCVRDLVQSEWLIVDNYHQDQVAEARARQRTDGQVTIPKVKDSYLGYFKKNVENGGNLGKLFHEAYEVVDRVNTDRATIFLKHLDKKINSILADDEVKAAAEACKVKKEQMSKFDTASSEITRVYSSLEDYVKLADHLISTKPAGIANEIFPASWQTMRQHKNDEFNIHKLLHNVHPLTARFLCYKLIDLLDKRISGRKIDPGLIDLPQPDFDTKGDNDPHTSASVALTKLQDRTIPILGSLISEKQRLQNITTKLEGEVVNKQTKNIDLYIRANLEVTTCKILKARVERLAENYATFFQSIDTMITDNHTRISRLEETTFPIGQTGVYCSKEALQTITAEYHNKADSDLSVATKTAIFESLFKILADDIAHDAKFETERQKAARAKKKAKALSNVFSTAVVDTVRTEVIKNGAGTVDMSVFEALKRQFELEAPERDDFEVYLQEIIRRAMKKAAPFVAVSENAAEESTATAYIAMHPDCAATVEGEPDVGATQKLFAPNASADTGNKKVTVLLDDAFSPYELTCFRAKYKFSIEDLSQYAITADNYKAYYDRIQHLGKNPVFTGNPDDSLTVITPHLDRHWHEEAYLPSLYKSERVQSKMNTAKAFIYALGFDWFTLIPDDNTLDESGHNRVTWHYSPDKKRYVPVQVRGSYIGKTYADLYNALPHNSRIKESILLEQKKAALLIKNVLSSDELYDNILDNPFIADLICSETESAKDKDSAKDRNILDIILDMRNTMHADEWGILFTGLRNVLWEFCAYLFDSNERKVNTAVRTILDSMKQHSTVAGKTQESPDCTYNERELLGHLDSIRSTPYKRT